MENTDISRKLAQARAFAELKTRIFNEKDVDLLEHLYRLFLVRKDVLRLSNLLDQSQDFLCQIENVRLLENYEVLDERIPEVLRYLIGSLMNNGVDIQKKFGIPAEQSYVESAIANPDNLLDSEFFDCEGDVSDDIVAQPYVGDDNLEGEQSVTTFQPDDNLDGGSCESSCSDCSCK
jgi:hypothetical protein